MKISRTGLLTTLRISVFTLNRIISDDKTFPKPQTIGTTHYFDECELFNWIASRSTGEVEFLETDKIITSSELCKMIGRSSTWVWRNLISTNAVPRIRLTDSSSTKNLFIRRTIEESCRELIPTEESLADERAILERRIGLIDQRIAAS